MTTYAIGGGAFAAFLNQSRGNTEAVPGPGFVNETGDISAGPATGAILFTGFAPTTNTDAAVSPATGSVVFTGFAPSAAITVAPDTGSVLFTGFAPTIVKLAGGGFFHPVF